MIDIKGITKSFGSLQVLKGIDLHIDKGEVVSIVGPSGAGKTTLLQIIGTLDKPDSGSIMVDGIDVSSLSTKKLSDFRSLIEVFIEENKKLSAEELATLVVKRSGIVSDLFQDRSVEGVSKQENLQELLKGIAEFCEIRREEGMEQVAMSDFLAEVSLLTDQDNDKEENSDARRNNHYKAIRFTDFVLRRILNDSGDYCHG